MDMKPPATRFDPALRRASAKRTALILGAVALAMYALAILEAVFKS